VPTPVKRLFGMAVFLGALALTSVPAIAHAVLVASEPSAGERLEHPPQTVTLTFDEPVETALGSLRVLDAAGVLHSVGTVVHPGSDPARIAVHLTNLETGRYVVAWQVVSADSHIVNGAYAFGVGAPAGPAPAAATDTGATVLLPIIHFGILAGVLLGIGMPIGAATVGRRAHRAPNFVEFGAWFVLAFCAFSDVALRADLAGGTLAAAFTTHVGVLRLTTIGAALAGIVAVSHRRRWWNLLATACIVAAVSLSLAGHAAGSEPVALGVAADALHLIAAAAWVGVLAIGTTLEPTEDLRGISPIAIAAVSAIVVSGIVQTIRNVGSVSALLTTPYGRDIDIKIVLLLAALGVALLSRRALAKSRFAIGHWLKLELWLLTAVIAVTAVLVESPLPREAAPLASVATTFVVRDITVHVSATTTGQRQWEIRVNGTGAGGASRTLDGVDVSVRETVRNVGPLVVPMARTADGSFDGTTTLPFDGSWSALISARSGDFDENHSIVPLKESTP
jgi:copper transport protein